MFPTVLGIDENAEFVPGASSSLATGWEFNEDGTVLTVTLREDYFWSDGEQVTAEDIKFTYDAIASGEIESDLTGFIDTIVTGVEVVDDFTVTFTFAEADCTALSTAAFPVVPAHKWGSFAEMIDPDYDAAPDITAGLFEYLDAETGLQIRLAANQDYPDAADGVVPQGYIYVDVADQSVEVDRFLAGELNFIEAPQPARRPEIRESDSQTFEFPGNSYSWIAFNLADPENPQPGLDEAGSPVEQTPHPIFGDVRVRQALAHAVDVESIIANILLGEGTRITAFEPPTSWAYNTDLAPRTFDMEAAAALLDEAGWTDEDGDGVRECHGCMYAEEGTPFEVDLSTNEDNNARVEIGTYFQDQMTQLGVQVNFAPVDFNTLVDALLNQTFDLAILGWSLSYPPDPDQQQIFSREADVPGGGFNFGSYHNDEFMELNNQGRLFESTNGCDLTARADYYKQMQELILEDQPYIFIAQGRNMYAAGGNVGNWGPIANQPFFNVEEWAIQQ
jgi:peptide/nickel transport system substrate-binding protein